jgi:hypothetical protein
MQSLAKLAAVAVLGVGALVASSVTASAAIVCNREGACWHVRHPYRYQPGWGVVVHPDSWRWGPNEHYAWREHPGRGYWRNGVWVTF